MFERAKTVKRQRALILSATTRFSLNFDVERIASRTEIIEELKKFRTPDYNKRRKLTDANHNEMAQNCGDGSNSTKNDGPIPSTSSNRVVSAQQNGAASGQNDAEISPQSPVVPHANHDENTNANDDEMSQNGTISKPTLPNDNPSPSTSTSTSPNRDSQTHQNGAAMSENAVNANNAGILQPCPVTQGNRDENSNDLNAIAMAQQNFVADFPLMFEIKHDSLVMNRVIELSYNWERHNLVDMKYMATAKDNYQKTNLQSHTTQKRNSLENIKHSDICFDFKGAIIIRYTRQKKLTYWKPKWTDCKVGKGQLLYDSEASFLFPLNNKNLRTANADEVIQTIILQRYASASTANSIKHLTYPKSTEPREVSAYVLPRIYRGNANTLNWTLRVCVGVDDSPRNADGNATYEYHYDCQRQGYTELKRDGDYVSFYCRCYELSKGYRCHSEVQVRRQDLLQIKSLFFTSNLMVRLKHGIHWCDYCKFHVDNRYSDRNDINRWLSVAEYQADPKLYLRRCMFEVMHKNHQTGKEPTKAGKNPIRAEE